MVPFPCIGLLISNPRQSYIQVFRALKSEIIGLNNYHSQREFQFMGLVPRACKRINGTTPVHWEVMVHDWDSFHHVTNTVLSKQK